MRGSFVGSEIEGGRKGGRALMRGEKESGVGEKKDWEKTH